MPNMTEEEKLALRAHYFANGQKILSEMEHFLYQGGEFKRRGSSDINQTSEEEEEEEIVKIQSRPSLFPPVISSQMDKMEEVS